MTESQKKSICIILGTAHGVEVSGKRSPDGTLKEYAWSREMCKELCKRLQNAGYRCIIDHTGQNEIGLGNRCQIVNNYCNIFGSKKCLYISMHVNAKGNGKDWETASGWQTHCSKNASERSHTFAKLIYAAIEEQNIKVRRPKKTQDWFENDFTVITKTRCPAVLCENMFMDNKKDAEFLLSKDGKDALIAAYMKAIQMYVEGEVNE